MFPKATGLTYPIMPSFDQRFPGLVSKGTLALCMSHFKPLRAPRSSSKSKRKMQVEIQRPDKCDFLDQFDGNLPHKKVQFTLKHIFGNGESFSRFVDSGFKEGSPRGFFDLDQLNSSIRDIQKCDAGFARVKELLRTDEKKLFIMFGFQGSGKSYFCREHLEGVEVVSNVG